jgi:hypothetical protein
VHEKRIADAMPYPLPAESRLLQGLGFLAFTLPQVKTSYRLRDSSAKN